MEPHVRQSDGRAVSPPFGDNPAFFFSQQDKLRLGAEAKRRVPRGRRSAVRAGSRVLTTPTRNQTLSPLCGRKSRADKVVGFLREAPWVTPLRGGSFGTFLSPRKEKYICKTLL